MLRAWLELARISNLPTVWTNVLAGWLLAGGKWDWPVLAWLLGGGSLLYTGGMILNDAADVRFDREARKERPIPSGRVTAAAAWSVGLGFIAVGFAMCVWGADACAWLTGALVAAIIGYDLYHKPWPGSVFIMGSCRTLLYLVAASAKLEHFNVRDHYEVIIKAIALGGYVVGLSLVARHEGAAMKPSQVWLVLGVFGLAMPLISGGWFHNFLNDALKCGLYSVGFFATYRWSNMQELTTRERRVLAIALLLFGGVLAFMLISEIPSHPQKSLKSVLFVVLIFTIYVLYDKSMKLMRTPPPSNIGRAVGLLLAGIVLVDALAVCNVAPIAALCFALSMPLLLLWQRKIAAT